MSTSNSPDTQDVCPYPPPNDWQWFGPPIAIGVNKFSVRLRHKITGATVCGESEDQNSACANALAKYAVRELVELGYGAKPISRFNDLPAKLAALALFLKAEGMPRAAEVVTEAKAALERPRRDFEVTP